MEAALGKTRRWLLVTGAVNLIPLGLLTAGASSPHAHGYGLPGIGYELVYLGCLLVFGMSLGRPDELRPLGVGLLVLWCTDGLSAWVGAVSSMEGVALLSVPLVLLLYKSWGLVVLSHVICVGPALGPAAPWRARLLALGFALFGLLGIGSAFRIQRETREHEELELECRSRLLSWHSQQMTYFDEHRSYDATLATPPDPEPGASPHSQMLTWDQPGLARITGGVSVGLTGVCPDCQIAALCVSQLESAPDDAWSVSTRERLGPTGAIARGQIVDERTGRVALRLFW